MTLQHADAALLRRPLPVLSPCSPAGAFSWELSVFSKQSFLGLSRVPELPERAPSPCSPAAAFSWELSVFSKKSFLGLSWVPELPGARAAGGSVAVYDSALSGAVSPGPALLAFWGITPGLMLHAFCPGRDLPGAGPAGALSPSEASNAQKDHFA